jgi:salicylate hydroxylase
VASGAPVLIVGGGIGGLSAALALAREGIAVHILEAAPEFAEIGAGLQIGPNGSRILIRWGLGDALDAQARRPGGLVLMDGISGRRLARMPLGEVAEKRYGAPYLVMARHALHGMLVEAARANPNIILSCGMPVATCSVVGDAVFVGGANGSRPLEGRALIAADGVHSGLRLQFFGARARPSGRMALRALAQAPASLAGVIEEDSIGVWMAPDAHLVHYPIGAGGLLNLVAIVRDGGEPPDRQPVLEGAAVGAAFRHWTRDAQDLVAAAGSWTRWRLLTMPALPAWSRGPMTLLGDAAHPLLPFLASGAVMAIEDAAVLAQELALSPDDSAAALERYEARRRPRLARLQAAVTRAGEIYHMSGAMRHARNLSLAALPARALMARNDWLYGFRV